MRELTVRIKFIKHCLGNARQSDGSFLFIRSPADNRILFLASWWQANMRFAAELIGKHLKTVGSICWDIAIDVADTDVTFFRRYTNKSSYAKHECIVPGAIVSINCVVPSDISIDDFWALLTTAGQYKGLSPFAPSEYGSFSVESIRERR